LILGPAFEPDLISIIFKILAIETLEGGLFINSEDIRRELVMETREMIREFITESRENLDQFDHDLINIEESPDSPDLLERVFRTIHNIKGSCGLIGYVKLESLTHSGENLLDKLQQGKLAPTPEVMNTLHKLSDSARRIFTCIANQGNEGGLDFSELVMTMERFQTETNDKLLPSNGNGAKHASLYERIGGQEAVDAAVNLFYPKVLQDDRINLFFENMDLNYLMNKQKQFLAFAFGGPNQYDGKGLREVHKHLTEEKGLNESHFDAVIENFSSALKELNVPEELIVEASSIACSVKNDVLNQSPAPPLEGAALPEEVIKPGIPTPVEVKPETASSNGKAKKASSSGAAKKDERKLEDSSIRVDVQLLDKLMNLVGELVLARNQILQFNSTHHDAAFLETSQHLNLVTSDLQEGVMKTRMQPIGGVWSKFPRIVRDLSMECGKKIRLETEGKDTELDKTLIEAIKDPLTHIIRNSVDHGIETPDVRLGQGKPEEGVLQLKAFHEGGQVNIEIQDDGGGIDPEKLKEKALSKGLISIEQAAKMGDRELVNLIFMPGLSTAEKVTNVSGRGVGMDVVRTNIEKIGGTVDIHTRKGEGTTLKVKIPLTLAIIPALIVSTGGNQYAIPQVNLLELVRLDEEQSETVIETVQGTPVYRLRGNLLPIVNLHDELGFPEKETGQTATNIVVLSANERQFGLVVEEICDSEEIVVKPLGNQLKGISGFSGATIMGDGSVALILDIMGLAQKANVIRENQEQTAADSKDEGAAGKDMTDKETLLIFRVGKEGRSSMPLSAVARLEEFKCSDIEHSGDNEVIQYRGEIIPLIDLSKFFDSSKQIVRNETIQTIIYTRENKSVALVVDQILDIVEENIATKRSLTHKGVLGTVVIQNMVTDLIDMEGIVRETDPTFFKNQSEVVSLTH
jgi:two-component system, chemotaxis family, sensor kinase CheA